MQIVRYRDFSDSKTVIEVEEGKRIADVVPVSDWSKYAILINGSKGDENHVLRSTDIVVIRSVPHAIGAIITSVVLAVAAIGVAIYAGVQSYSAKRAAEKAAKELEKLKNQTNDSTVNVPYMKGASNSIATGKSQPYIIGRHLFTPYILNSGKSSSKGYHTIGGVRGEESCYNAVLEGGFGKQILDSLSADDIQVATLATEQPQENDLTNPRYYLNEESVFGSASSFLEISQDGQGFENECFNKKIVEQEPNVQLKKSDAEDYEDLYFTLENNSKACDICIMFNGLYLQDANGVRGQRSVDVIPEYSVDYAERVKKGNSPESATWIPFTFHQVYSGYQHEHRRTGYYEFSLEGYHGTGIMPWTLTNGEAVRIARENMDEWNYIDGYDIKDERKATFDFYEYDRDEDVLRIRCTYIYWEDVFYEKDSNTFSFQRNRQMRFEAHADFTFAQRFDQTQGGGFSHKKDPITVRLRCTTPAVSASSGFSEVSDCYVEYVHSHCYDVAESLKAQSLVDEKIIGDREAARSTLIGVHIKATQANQDKLGKINVVTNGVAPVCVYNSSTRKWEWDLANRKPTMNPASWILEVLTSDTHPASKVSAADEIDLDSFADLYRHCEENALTVNLVLTKEQKKSAVLDTLLNVCHAALYQNLYGKCAVAIDCAKENAIAVLNEQNMVSFSWEKQIALDVDGVRMTYIDEDSNWQENSFVRMYDPEATIGENTVLRDITADGITNFTQAHRHAHYIMSCAKLRPTKARAVVGREGIYFAPLEKVLVQHPSLKAGLGNTIVKSLLVNNNNEIIAIDLYDAIDIDTDNEYIMVVQCVSDSYCSPLALEIDSALSVRSPKIAYLKTPLPLDSAVIPHAGDVMSYGYKGSLATITREFLILAIEPNGSDGYALTLTEYNDAVYDCDASTIPEYYPAITQPREFRNELPREVPSPVSAMYQDFKFAVGDFNLTDEQARLLDWFDAPPAVPEGKCLYMATKWIRP